MPCCLHLTQSMVVGQAELLSSLCLSQSFPLCSQLLLLCQESSSACSYTQISYYITKFNTTNAPEFGSTEQFS